jgi:hypothetical protein
MTPDTAATAEPIACPICGQPLKSTSTPDRWAWLAVFECSRCGQFSNFGGASLAPAQGRLFARDRDESTSPSLRRRAR